MTSGNKNAHERYNLGGNTPVALAARWFDAAEAEVNGGGIEDPETWQVMLDEVECVAKIDPGVLLEVARMQLVEESLGPEERFIALSSLIQLAAMKRQLDDRAASIATVFAHEEMAPEQPF